MGFNMSDIIKWEYKTVNSSGLIGNFEFILNELGREGWELCAINAGIFYLKRPLKGIL